MKIYFSDFFGVSREDLKSYGAFDVSLLADLPLFVDPFLLFNSKRADYQTLHDGIIDYLRFLAQKSTNQGLDTHLLLALYTFQEVKQNWLGFSESGNKGSGLGRKFAIALHKNLAQMFSDFGNEHHVTKGSHLEKLCLIESGVGRDTISDFTTNLIKGYLLEYTQAFTQQFIADDLSKDFMVEKVHFNYETETWQSQEFRLPSFGNDFVILTPKNILTREDTWISRHGLIHEFDMVREAVPDGQLRALINNYFKKVLPKKPTPKDKREAAARTIRQFPELINTFIRYKEDHGDEAVQTSTTKVRSSEELYLEQFGRLAELADEFSDFYKIPGDTLTEARKRAHFLKDVIENKGGHKLFYLGEEPIHRETDLHILYRLTWFATPLDVSREVNDGRGPADYKISPATATGTPGRMFTFTLTTANFGKAPTLMADCSKIPATTCAIQGAMLSVQTSKPSSSTPAFVFKFPPIAPFGLLGMVFGIFVIRKRAARLTLALACLGLLTACGGHVSGALPGNPGPIVNPGTPSGTYMIVISAAGTQTTMAVMLTIQ
jgi:hypothetical protein